VTLGTSVVKEPLKGVGERTVNLTLPGPHVLELETAQNSVADVTAAFEWFPKAAGRCLGTNLMSCGDRSPKPFSYSLSFDFCCQWPVAGDVAEFWLQTIDGHLQGAKSVQDFFNAAVDAAELCTGLCDILSAESCTLSN
jgi:hypothetical protein